MELKTTFQKLNKEIKAKILEQLKTKEVQEAITKIKEAEDSGKFEVIISTGDVDRMGESLSPEGWDLEFYKTNPVVLWAHDYMGLPIGLSENIEVKEGKLVASGKFAPADANPFAQQVRKLYEGGFVRSASVGFLEKEREDNQILKAELLEWSFVPVPANPFALSTLNQMGMRCGELITKGVVVPDYEQKPEPEITEDYIRIRVKDPDYFDPDSFRTITISEDEGIKAVIGCKKGEYEGGKCQIGTEVQSYLFDKEKWTLSEAQDWVEEHEKSKKQEEGDVCTLPDGTEGEYQKDEDGELYCGAKKSQKGAVQDVSEQMEFQKQKWEKITPIWDIFDAFLSVYLNSETKVEAFGELLAETIELMKKYIPEGTVAAKEIVEKVIGKVKQETTEKIGAELTQMQTKIDSAIVECSRKIIELLSEKKLSAALGNQKPQGDEPGDGAKSGREPAGLKDLEDYLFLRQILQKVDKVIEDGLRKTKEKIRSSK